MFAKWRVIPECRRLCLIDHPYAVSGGRLSAGHFIVAGLHIKLRPEAFLLNRTALRRVPSQLCSRPLLPRQYGRQKPEFGLHFRGICHGIGDFLTEEFAISLPQPVNRNFERSF